MPLFVLAHFGHHLLTALPIPMLPLIRDDFSLDYTRSGLVTSAFSLSYGIAQLPAGWMADHTSPRILITVGISGVALAGLLVGLSQTYVMMIVFLALMGILAGGYHPSAPPIISASVEPGKRGQALGLHLIGGSASYFLAPLIAAAIAVIWGWRGSFICLAIPAMIFGLVFYVLLGRLALIRKAKPGETVTREEASFPPGRLRRLVVFIILSTFTGAVVVSSVSFIPLFLVDNFGVAKETSGAWLAIVYSAGLWASPLGGHISDRLGRVPVILAICFLAGPAIYSLNLVPFPWGIGALLLIIGVIMSSRMPVSESYIVGQTSEHNRSTILGIYFFGAMEGGGVLTPVLGYLIDHLGFYTSFTIVSAALFAVTLVCSALLRGSRE